MDIALAQGFLVGLGLTAQEKRVLFEGELYTGRKPIGIQKVYDFIHKPEHKDLFDNCIVTVQYDKTYVQRIKQTKKYI